MKGFPNRAVNRGRRRRARSCREVSVPVMPTGTIGTPVFTASISVPGFPACNCPFFERVPSGAIPSARPSFNALAALWMAEKSAISRLIQFPPQYL